VAGYCDRIRKQELITNSQYLYMLENEIHDLPVHLDLAELVYYVMVNISIIL